MNSDRFDTFRVGLIFPMSGPFGIIGPSSELSAQLARDELNASAGVLGRRVELMSIDGGRDPVTVAHEVATLLDAGALDAVAGMHTSAVRRAVIPVTLGRIPYVYTSMYEGGDRYPGLFITGETPANQLVPALECSMKLASHSPSNHEVAALGHARRPGASTSPVAARP